MLIKYDPKIQNARRNFRSLIVTSIVFTVIVILLISPLSNPGFLTSMKLAAREPADAALSSAQIPQVLVAQVVQEPTRISVDRQSTATPPASTPAATAISVQPAPTLIVLTSTPTTTVIPEQTVTVSASIATQAVLTPTSRPTMELTLTEPAQMPTATAATPTRPATVVTEPVLTPVVLAATSFTATATGVPTPTQTIGATPTPTQSVPPLRLVPTATPTVAPPAPVGSVQLVAPAPETASNQPKVDFAWQIVDLPLAADQCAELVFWDPANPADQRSPIGAGKEDRKRVAFDFLATSADPLLRTLAQSRRALQWGVRIVSCAEPQNVLRAAEEVRVYTYQP